MVRLISCQPLRPPLVLLASLFLLQVSQISCTPHLTTGLGGDQLQSSNNSDNCPPWSLPNSKCECGHGYQELIMCQRDNDSDPTSWSLSLLVGYCMTTNEDHTQTYVISCPYDTSFNHTLSQLHVEIDTTMSQLNNYTCKDLNRHGVHCSRCNPDHGPSVFTLDLKCYDCRKSYHGWGLYLTLEIVPLTIFFVFIVAFQIKPTSGNLNSFVLFSQIIVSQLTFGTQVAFERSLDVFSVVVVRFLQIGYGIWNLDFFRFVIPPFCVSSNINNLQVLVLQYISVFYPMCLIFGAWLFCELYQRNCRPIVYIWRPFRRYLSHFSITNNPKRSIVNVFATFLILSYSKLLFVSVNLLNVATVYHVDKKNLSKTVLFEPTMKYFSGKHLPYVSVSFLVIATFITLPPLILLLYQLDVFKKTLNVCHIRSQTFRMFADACQSCFKDGSNGTRDCRYFAGAYLLLRASLFLANTAPHSKVTSWLLLAILFIGSAVFIGVVRPYKKMAFNCLDVTMMSLFGVGAIFSSVATFRLEAPQSFTRVIYTVLFLIALAPLTYMVAYILIVLLKHFKSLCHWRRRGYVEISDYAYESDCEESENQKQQYHRYVRYGNSDSFQSE